MDFYNIGRKGRGFTRLEEKMGFLQCWKNIKFLKIKLEEKIGIFLMLEEKIGIFPMLEDMHRVCIIFK